MHFVQTKNRALSVQFMVYPLEMDTHKQVDAKYLHSKFVLSQHFGF